MIQMKLKDYLKVRKMSQVEFAKLTGISKPAISNYIHGVRTPTLEIANKIFKFTKGAVTFSDLLD